MRKSSNLLRLILGFLALVFPAISFGGMKVEECQAQPDFFNRPRAALIKSISSLPHLVFVARKADYYIENKSQSFQIWGQQSFTRVESKILCATLPKAGKQAQDLDFSIYAPTLIDLTGEQKVGHSFWQFHLTAESSQLGIWNQKSRLFSKGKDFEAQLLKMGVQVQIFQISNHEFELFLSRESNLFSETLAVRFDAVSKVD